MINAGIIGATGYVGIELLRLLQQHPEVHVRHAFTKSYIKQEIIKVYPHLSGLSTIALDEVDFDLIQKHCDVIFICLPHGQAQDLAQPLLDFGIKVIDLGADFRLDQPSVYQQWYQKPPASESLLKVAVYGLPEKGNKKAISHAQLVANPGCYPTAALLATIPALKAGIIDANEFLFDAKSGVSGTGRAHSLNNHFCEITENLIPYQLAGKHRHIPEIEQELGLITKAPVTIQFTPHLIPIIRGLLVTAYFKLNDKISPETIHAIYQNYYAQEAFVRVSPLNTTPQVKQVRGTNFCDIGIHVDTRSGRLLVISVIDNLIKGAAGQAIQNMNLMFQLPETSGLNHLYAAYP